MSHVSMWEAPPLNQIMIVDLATLLRGGMNPGKWVIPRAKQVIPGVTNLGWAKRAPGRWCWQRAASDDQSAILQKTAVAAWWQSPRERFPSIS